jgi:hypothetical protein
MSATRARSSSKFKIENLNINQQSTTKNRPASAFFGKSIISRPASAAGNATS